MNDKIKIVFVILALGFAIIFLFTFGVSHIDYSKITEEQRLAGLNRLGGVEGLTWMLVVYIVLPTALAAVIIYGWPDEEKEAYK